jgi:hypothetical protein
VGFKFLGSEVTSRTCEHACGSPPVGTGQEGVINLRNQSISSDTRTFKKGSINDNNQPYLPISLVFAVASEGMADSTLLDLGLSLDIALQNDQMDTNAQDKMQYFENRQPPQEKFIEYRST